jgi:hypothetical protein
MLATKIKNLFKISNILEYILFLVFISFVGYLRFSTLPIREIKVEEDNSVIVTTEFNNIIDYKEFILIIIATCIFIILKLLIIKFDFTTINLILFLKLSILLTFSFILISTFTLLVVKFYNLYEYSIWSRRAVISFSIIVFYFFKNILYKSEELVHYLLSCSMYVFPTFILGILIDIGFL